MIANTLSVIQIENLISNLMAASEMLIATSFERHAAIEELISRLDSSLNQRFELIG